MHCSYGRYKCAGLFLFSVRCRLCRAFPAPAERHLLGSGLQARGRRKGEMGEDAAADTKEEF